MVQLKKLLVLMCGLVLSNACLAQKNINFTLHQALIHTQKEYGIQAISLSINLPDMTNIDITSGTISKDNQTKINSSHLFQVASITKTFIATIILQLEQEGKLSIDDPIGTWLPQYIDWKNITIKQLLNHTSGIADYIDSEKWWDNLYKDKTKVWKSDELLAISSRMSPYFPPSKGWHYSNANYVLVGLIIEKVTGHTVTEEMQQRFIDNTRLGLRDSYYAPVNYPKFILQRIVHGYFARDDMTLQNTSWLQAAGALISTPHDLTHWARLLFNSVVLHDKQLGEMTSLISTKTGKPLTNLEDPSVGLSVFRINTPYGWMWYTPGLAPGYRSILVSMPCDNIVFSYSVSDAVKGEGFHAYLISQIMDVLLADRNIKEAIYRYSHSSTYPVYCRDHISSKQFQFPNF